MQKYNFKNPRFIKSATKLAEYPDLKDDRGLALPEIAVAGRSNVGKSTLLNHLFQRKGLVKTSAAPGKTQTLNFFTLNNQLTFVDLPGYGFARVPIDVRKRWGPMVQSYLEKRVPLQLLLFLFDIRRIPNDEDRQLMEWAECKKLPVILILTKTDKIKRNQIVPNTTKILQEFDKSAVPHIHYTVKSGQAKEALIKRICMTLSERKD